MAAGGCAGNSARAAVASGTTEILRADEIRKSGATDAYQAIRTLRPAFLQTRGRTSMVRTENAEPAVYVDDRPFGSIATLRDIPAREIVDIRYFGPAQAQMRWGAGNSAGAILVRTGTPR
jgi:hypothetical protein